MAGEPSGIDLPVVASLEDVKAMQAEIEKLKADVAALQAASVQMPADVKEAFLKWLEWVKANV
jgi:endonuclease/exonuclease/phosphatase family metal-dependent hydrolase